MSEKTGIEWTDATWNPIRGCSRVSAGCENCYAERVAGRFSGPGMAYEGLVRIRTNGQPQWNGRITVVEKHMEDPIRWRTPRRIFVNSMSDLFHPNVDDETIGRIFAVMGRAPQHTFQILTKRPERMHNYMSDGAGYRAFNDVRLETEQWPPANVWLGVSCEDQAAADQRIPILLRTSAAVRWVSAEPLLGPINFIKHVGTWHDRKIPGQRIYVPSLLEWVVVGGESGPGRRAFDPQWARDIREQCKAAGVAFFGKQHDKVIPLPDDLMVREFPMLSSMRVQRDGGQG